ncbi:hypothetical protein [Leuconostoc mesenteroides]|uniref:hypothetical protein n=1 Tax=Leuconostoc mesenteroides TaxID=1245 RepID=UPI00235E8ED2|nr:hypothetical protein [Leuconostoc mesenteroides]
MLYIIDSDVLDKIRDDHINSNDITKLNSLFALLNDIVMSRFNEVSVDDNDFQNTIISINKSNFIQTNKVAKRVMTHIFNRYQEVFSLVDKLSIKTFITWQKVDVKIISSEVNLPEPIKIDVDNFINTSNSIRFDDAISLAVENTNDFALYKNFVKYFSPSFDNNLSNFFLNVVNGGGDTIGTVIESEVENNHRFTVAITDSDRTFGKKEDYIGQTASKAISSSQKLNSMHLVPVSKVFVLNVNEKENLFSPVEYAKAFENGRQDKRRTLQWLSIIEKEILNKDDKDLQLFLNIFDYKKGIQSSTYTTIMEKNPEVDRVMIQWGNKTNFLTGLGRDPVKRFFPIQDEQQWDYSSGIFNYKIIDQTSFIHCYRVQIAFFLYSLGFGYRQSLAI